MGEGHRLLGYIRGSSNMRVGDLVRDLVTSKLYMVTAEVGSYSKSFVPVICVSTGQKCQINVACVVIQVLHPNGWR